MRDVRERPAYPKALWVFNHLSLAAIMSELRVARAVATRQSRAVFQEGSCRVATKTRNHETFRFFVSSCFRGSQLPQVVVAHREDLEALRSPRGAKRHSVADLRRQQRPGQRRAP